MSDPTNKHRSARVRRWVALVTVGLASCLAGPVAGASATATWTSQSPSTAPAARDGMALAYDGAAGEDVAFGGRYLGSSTWGSAQTFDAGGGASTAISCPTTSFCVAVDATGHATIYNGTTWSSTSDIDSSNELWAVSCTSSSFCVATDTTGHVLTYNGTTWSAASDIDGSVPLYGVSCASTSFCMVLDQTGHAFTYNGTTWSGATLMDSGNETSGVSCPTTTFCEAIDAEGHAFKYTGTWSAATTIDSGKVIDGLSCPSTSFCAAVDTSGHAMTYNGTSWSAASDIDGSNSIGRVSCSSSSFCAAVDGSGNALTYNGSSWSAASDIDGTTQLTHVGCVSSSFCVAIDADDNYFLYGPATAYDQDTWLYTASSDTWTQESPSTKPSARSGAAIAYDSATSQIVLFGGVNGSTYDNDTWVYTPSNDTWTQESPSTHPTARSGAAMAYDSATSQIVLFGGVNGSTYDNDTWVYTPSNDTWTQESPSGPPSTRQGAAMTYATAANQVVLFGGQNGSTYDNDTWLFNPSADTWTQQSPATSPSARSFMGSAGDSTEMVIFGGTTAGGDVSDTWAYYGGNWTQQSPGTSPTARDTPAMTYDSTANEVVLFGGEASGSYQSDTWIGAFTTLGVQAPSTLAWTVTLNGHDQTSDQPATVTVDDTVGGGWNVDVSATTLTSGSHTLPALVVNGSAGSAAATTAPTATCAGGAGTCSAPAGNLAAYPLTLPTSTPTPLYTSNSGSGTDDVSLALDWWSSTPANAATGTYTNTITIAVASGP